MEIEGLFAALGQNGPFAIVCGILFWKDWQRDKRETERQIRLEVLDRDRVEADKALAVAMTKLAERIKDGPSSPSR